METLKAFWDWVLSWDTNKALGAWVAANYIILHIGHKVWGRVAARTKTTLDDEIHADVGETLDGLHKED